MKIQNNNAGSLGNVKTGQVRKGLNDKVTISSKDKLNSNKVNNGDVKVTLSGRAQDIQKAYNIATKTADVRPDKVAEMKSLIKAGNYKINSDAIADKMVDDALMDFLI